MSSLPSPSPSFLVGQFVHLELVDTGKVEGQIFAYDPSRGMVVLEEKPEHTILKSNFRVINEKFIVPASVAVVPERSQKLATDKLPEQSIERVLAREEKAMQNAALDVARIGVGVTEEAQAIFDGLCKM